MSTLPTKSELLARIKSLNHLRPNDVPDLIIMTAAVKARITETYLPDALNGSRLEGVPFDVVSTVREAMDHAEHMYDLHRWNIIVLYASRFDGYSLDDPIRTEL